VSPVIAILSVIAFAVAITLHFTGGFGGHADSWLFALIGLLLLALHVATGAPVVSWRPRHRGDGS
jgi:hypothetical protein